jgi:myo-inositol-1(or 4)-monophosphatase
MKKEDFSSLTLTAIQAALKAGDILRKGFGTACEIFEKTGRHNFVTEYDKASEACIISCIKENFPKHTILAEESGLSNQTEEDAILWIIDPLDGTTNFARHIPIFTISIAAYKGEKGICGVIFQPLTHELFFAENEHGAYLNGTRLAVSQTDRLDKAIMITGLPYERSSFSNFRMEQLLKLNQEGMSLRNFGSAALSLAYVAAGKADAFWMHNLFSWDLAAGKLLIEEAGGWMTRCDREPLSLHNPTSILATNQILHRPLLDYLG